VSRKVHALCLAPKNPPRRNARAYRAPVPQRRDQRTCPPPMATKWRPREPPRWPPPEKVALNHARERPRTRAVEILGQTSARQFGWPDPRAGISKPSGLGPAPAKEAEVYARRTPKKRSMGREAGSWSDRLSRLIPPGACIPPRPWPISRRVGVCPSNSRNDSAATVPFRPHLASPSSPNPPAARAMARRLPPQGIFPIARSKRKKKSAVWWAAQPQGQRLAPNVRWSAERAMKLLRALLIPDKVQARPR